MEHRTVTEGQLQTGGQHPNGGEEVKILDWGVGKKVSNQSKISLHGIKIMTPHKIYIASQESI